MSAPAPGPAKRSPGAPSDSTSSNDDGTPWQRLHIRMIWVDLLQSLLALAPVGFGVLLFGVELGDSGSWLLLGIAVSGVGGAAVDAWRWWFTRYRVTDEYVERRSGVFVRSYRSVRRDRIRSVDVEARLRHRIAGLRVVNIGAGQQAATGESALALDAVSAEDAQALRHLLLRSTSTSSTVVDVDAPVTETVAQAAGDDGAGDEKEVFAHFRPGWIVYNIFNIWAYVMALGLLWGGYWLASSVGLDVAGFAQGVLDWDTLGWGWSVAIGLLAVTVLGVLGLAINFFTEHWGFELARVPGTNGTLLRTRQGLLKTREVNRDDARMRGAQIAEPVVVDRITTSADRQKQGLALLGALGQRHGLAGPCTELIFHDRY
jgi:putative membrane protein